MSGGRAGSLLFIHKANYSTNFLDPVIILGSQLRVPLQWFAGSHRKTGLVLFTTTPYLSVMSTEGILIAGLLGLIIIKLFIMPTKEEFDALRQEMNDGLNNIADDITRLTDAIAAGDLTADEEAQLFTDLRAVADRIRSIADVTPEGDAPPAPEA